MRPLSAKPSLSCFDDEQAEAASVVTATWKAVAEGTAPSEVAVVYRFNATQAHFEAACARSGIATLESKGVAFFEREEGRVLVPFVQAGLVSPVPPGMGRTTVTTKHAPQHGGVQLHMSAAQAEGVTGCPTWPPGTHTQCRVTPERGSSPTCWSISAMPQTSHDHFDTSLGLRAQSPQSSWNQ